MNYIVLARDPDGYWKPYVTTRAWTLVLDIGRILAEEYAYTNVIALVFDRHLTWPHDIEVISSMHGMVDHY